MNKALVTLMAAAALPLSACATTPHDSTLASVGTGAAIGAAGGAGVAALTGGGLLTGAVIGAAVGGLAGAVWADRNNDGVSDGYVYNGQYYAGAPSGYGNSVSAAPACQSVGHSAAVGAVGGAVWADSNNDGCVDGYISNGQYYAGAPAPQPSYSTAPAYTGERG